MVLPMPLPPMTASFSPASRVKFEVGEQQRPGVAESQSFHLDGAAVQLFLGLEADVGVLPRADGLNSSILIFSSYF